MGRLAAIVPLLLLAAACGVLPRPFQPEDKSGNGLLRLEDSAGIVVLPIAAAPPGDPAEAAQALAEALRARNLPASTKDAGSPAERWLRGRASVAKLSGDREEIMLYWELSDARGKRLGAHAQRSELPAGLWRTGDPEAIDRVFGQAAEAIAAMVRLPEPAAPAIPGLPGGRLAVLPMPGLPGDGGTTLVAALKTELRAARLPLVDWIREHDLLIAGQVRLGPTRGYWQDVIVSWAVIRVSDGRELGRIDQGSRVPAGRLDGPWGQIAEDIAKGAAAGLLELIGQLQATG